MTVHLISPGHRLVLFNFVYDTDHLVWLYRSAIDSSPNAHMTSEHMCLIDFASRAAALARSLLDDDNRRRDTRLGFKPTPSAMRDRLRATLAARRQALKNYPSPSPAPAAAPPPDPLPEEVPAVADGWDAEALLTVNEFPDPNRGEEAPAGHDAGVQRRRMRLQ